MNAVDYAIVREVFHAARGMPRAARTTLLEDRFGARPDLRAEVESLLAWSATQDGDTRAGVDGATFADPAPPLPAQIGEHRILGILGEGASGVVYRAQQQSPRREVALKVLRAGVVSARGLRRFEHEAFLLGQLRHPNIAQVYTADAIVTAHGPQPYFTMELVVGRSLTEHAAEAGLDLPQRVELIATIADAIHHAHLRGVIHCDLKPANILVDAEGIPKVVDFGIARGTDPAVRAATLTGAQGLAGTLAYMSPEQTAGDPAHLDLRTDVYALGVVAYELLAGTLPYELPDRDLMAALQVVRETEPAPLGRHAPACRGDLTVVVSKALAKDRAARYASAGDLAADLRRCLRHLPVEARAPSAWYHLSKFARRRRGWLAATALVLVAGGTGVVSTILGAAEARRAARLTARGSDFLRRAMLDLDPRRVGGEVKLADVLRRIDAELGATFADEPGLAVEMRCAVASAMGTVGLVLEAERALRLAATQARTALGPEHALTLDALAAHASALEACGHYADAESGVRRVLATHTARGTSATREGLSVRHDLVRILSARGKHRDALAEMQQVVAGLEAGLGRDDPEVWRSKESLATEMDEVGDTADALTLAREVVAHYARTAGEDHPDRLGALANLASMLHDAGKSQEARTLLDEAVPALTRVLGATSPATLLARNHRARVIGALGDRVRCLDLQRELVADSIATLGAQHPDTILRRNNLGSTLTDMGQHEEATALYEEVVANAVAQLGSEHPAVMIARYNLAAAVRRRDPTRAEALLREVLAWRQRELGKEHPDTLVALNGLALLLQETQRNAEALPLQTEATALSRRILGDDHQDTLVAINNLAGVLLELKRYDEASELYREVLTRFRAVFGEEHPNVFTAINNVANLERARGNLAEAARCYAETLALGRHLPGIDEHALLSTIATYGYVLLQQGELDAAAPLIEEALARRRSRAETPYVGMLCGFLGELHARAGRITEARASFGEGIAALTADLPQSARSVFGLLEKEAASLAAASATGPEEARLLEVHRLLTTPPTAHAFGARKVAKMLADHYARQGNTDKAADYARLAEPPK